MEDVDLLSYQRVELIEEKKEALGKLTFGTDEYYRIMWDYDR